MTAESLWISAPTSSTLPLNECPVIDMSLSFRSIGRPSCSPLYPFEVWPPNTIIELERKLSELLIIALMSPLPEPNRKMSMKMPHATANPVSAVRSLLRRAVAQISVMMSLIS